MPVCVITEVALKHDRPMISQQRIGERDVVGTTPIDVTAERGARVVIDVNPLVPIPETWSPLES